MERRLISYNIHRFRGSDRRYDPERIVDLLADQRPDFIALQEIDTARLPDQACDHLTLLAERLQMHLAFCPTLRDRTGFYGHALLSRARWDALRRVELPTQGREPRAAMITTWSIAGRSVWLCSLHLSLRARLRAQQIEHLLEEIPAEQPQIWAGDFNLLSSRERAHELLQRRFGAIRAIRSFPSRLPLFALDRVLATRPIAISHLSALRQAGLASDHLPLLAQLQFPR